MFLVAVGIEVIGLMSVSDSLRFMSSVHIVTSCNVQHARFSYKSILKHHTIILVHEMAHSRPWLSSKLLNNPL